MGKYNNIVNKHTSQFIVPREMFFEDIPSDIEQETREELKRMNYRSNPYLDRFVTNNYGKLKAWVITRIVPSCYAIANPLVKAAL